MGKAKKFFMYLILTVASILSVFPLYYMFCASTNRSIDVIAGKLIPGTYLIDNFKFSVFWSARSPVMDLRSIMIKQKMRYLPYF